jgi:hypothetical protein
MVVFPKKIFEAHKIKNINKGAIFVLCNYKEKQFEHKEKGFLL